MTSLQAVRLDECLSGLLSINPLPYEACGRDLLYENRFQRERDSREW